MFQLKKTAGFWWHSSPASAAKSMSGSKFGGASVSSGDEKVVIVDQPDLDDLELLFERGGGCSRDARAVSPELQKKWALLPDSLACLQMTILPNSLGLLEFGLEFPKKKLSIAKKAKILQNTATDEMVARNRVEYELVRLDSSFTASNELAAQLTKPDKAIKAVSTKRVLLKRQVLHVNTESSVLEKIFAEVFEALEQRMVLLNAVFFRRKSGEEADAFSGDEIRKCRRYC